tara:strand:- start:306 stop:674 length:369 start_codon:yes stop_codon:yes gene_type:complete
MKEKLTFLVGVYFSLVSCSNSVTADFEITNGTGMRIDSLKIEPMVISNGNYISLDSNEKAKYIADMTDIPKHDGSYGISYQINEENKIKDFGYYTNGYPLEKITKIEIQGETILIDQIFSSY